MTGLAQPCYDLVTRKPTAIRSARKICRQIVYAGPALACECRALGYLGMEGAPETQGMMFWIRVAAKEIRQEHGHSPARIAAERDVRESTVTRFEAGTTMQVDEDRMIAAYARVCGMEPIEFYERALALWRADAGSAR